jgi:2',3'-cyclic-nucleotide 2'-phosphodiesterase (5'-nucleotidase family)
MIGLKRMVPLLLTLASVAMLGAQENPELGPHGPSQVAADALRSFAQSDGAFLVAGIVRQNYSKDNLATLLQFPTDSIVVLGLTGTQVRLAFERSVSLYPLANASFLQISGFEVVFDKSAPPNRRVTSVTAGGAKLDENKVYSVAMPSTLSRGAMGYFKVWDKAKVIRDFPNNSMESILRGKLASDSPPRWTATGTQN